MLTSGLVALLSCVGTALAEPPETAERVAVIGASASDGFGAYYWRLEDGARVRDRVDLAELVRSASGESLVVADLATAQFFANPAGIGTQIVDRAIRSDPDVVIAIDFLFWFSYGTVGIDARRIRTDEDRLAMLEFGLDLLDRIDVPIVVGDIPDMSAASGGVLMPSAVPSEEMRNRINRRIREWAAERDRVVVFPLSDLHGRLGRGEAIRIGDQLLPAVERDRMLQRDRLHPTLGGLLAIVAELDAVIRANDALDDRVPPLEVDFETLRTRIRGYATAPDSWTDAEDETASDPIGD